MSVPWTVREFTPAGVSSVNTVSRCVVCNLFTDRKNENGELLHFRITLDSPRKGKEATTFVRIHSKCLKEMTGAMQPGPAYRGYLGK